MAVYTHRLLIPVGISLITGTSYAENTSSRQSFDLSSRMVYSGVDDSLGFMHAFGIDYHKVVSDAQGDIGTLTAQLYVTRIDNLSPSTIFLMINTIPSWSPEYSTLITQEWAKIYPISKLVTLNYRLGQNIVSTPTELCSSIPTQ